MSCASFCPQTWHYDWWLFRAPKAPLHTNETKPLMTQSHSNEYPYKKIIVYCFTYNYVEKTRFWNGLQQNNNRKTGNNSDNNNHAQTTGLCSELPGEIWRDIVGRCDTQDKLQIRYCLLGVCCVFTLAGVRVLFCPECARLPCPLNCNLCSFSFTSSLFFDRRSVSKLMRQIVDTSFQLQITASIIDMMQSSLLPLHFSHYHLPLPCHFSTPLPDNVVKSLTVSDGSTVAANHYHREYRPDNSGTTWSTLTSCLIPKAIEELRLLLFPSVVVWSDLRQYSSLTSLHLPKFHNTNQLTTLPSSIKRLSFGEYNYSNDSNHDNSILDLSHLALLTSLNIDNLLCTRDIPFFVVNALSLQLLRIAVHACRLSSEVLRHLPPVPYLEVTILGMLPFPPPEFIRLLPSHVSTLRLAIGGQLTQADKAMLSENFSQKINIICL